MFDSIKNRQALVVITMITFIVNEVLHTGFNNPYPVGHNRHVSLCPLTDCVW
jgi:hypothetical protein